MPAYLRVYPRVVDTPEDTQTPTVRVRLGALFPLLAQAQRGNYLWLNDFEDDEVCITQDLYELLRASSAAGRRREHNRGVKQRPRMNTDKTRMEY